MRLKVSALQCAEMLKKMTKQPVTVVDGHVFVWADEKWNKLPMGYEGYDKPVKRMPKAKVENGDSV